MTKEEVNEWYDKGLVFYELGKYEEAINAYDKAIKINPKEVGHWYNPQVNTALLRFPGFGRIRKEYEDNLLIELRKQIKQFNQIDSISIEIKNRIGLQVIKAIEHVIAIRVWDDVIEKYFIKIRDNTLFIVEFLFSLIYIWYLWIRGEFIWDFWVLGKFAIHSSIAVPIGFFIFVGILLFYQFISKKSINRKDGAIGLLLLLTAGVLGSLEVVWFPLIVHYSFIVSIVFLGSFLLTYYLYSWLWQMCRDFIWNKVCQYPEEGLIDQLIHVLFLIEEKPDNLREDQVRDIILGKLEWIAQRLEYNLSRKLPSYDSGTDAWLQKHGLEMAAGIRQLKKCVLIPRKENRERLISELSMRLINSADRDWYLFERMAPLDPPSLSNNMRVLNILRRFIAAIFPLLIVGLISISPIKLSDTIMGYIIAGSIGWAALVVLSWLDPDYQEKIDTFMDKSDIISYRKKK